MPRLLFDMQQTRKDVDSTSQELRVTAMQQLLLQVRKNAKYRKVALVIFESAVNNPRDAATAVLAARGIEFISEPTNVRAAWLKLLNHPEPKIVQAAALSVPDRSYLQTLADVMNQREELAIHSSVIRAMGRMKDSAAIPLIVKDLVHPGLRPDIIQALEELGDAAAISYLTPLLSDATDSWAQDNHGPTLRVCDLARTAISRLSSAASLREQCAPHSAIKNQLVVGRTLAIAAACLPDATRQFASRFSLGSFLLPYAPLAAAIVNVVWFAVLMFIWICKGQRSFSVAEELLCALPAFVGLLIGLPLLASGTTHRMVDLVFLYIGCICCALVVFSFLWEATHPA